MPWRFGLEAAADAGSAATPLMSMKEGVSPDLADHILGFRIGSMGESAIILIILAGIYLLWTRTAQWKLMLSTLLSFCAVILGIQAAGIVPKGGTVPFTLWESLFSGSILYVAVFMVTDPVSAPKKPGSQWVYGILAGTVSAAVRVFALFPEGVSFGILIANTFACLLDEWFPAAKKKPKKPQAAKTPQTRPAATDAGGGRS